MKLKIFFLVLCIFGNAIPKPVGLENCGNTCFMNAFLQILYQIDPIVDILTLPEAPKFYKENSLGYYLQQLMIQIKSYDVNDMKLVDCNINGPLYNFTHKGYSCINVDVGNPGDASAILSKTIYDLIESKNAVDPNAQWRYSLIDAVKVEMSRGGIPKGLEGRVSLSLMPIIDWNRNRAKGNLADLTASIISLHQKDKITYRNIPQFFIFYTLDRDIGPVDASDSLDLSSFMENNAKAVYDLRAIGIHRGDKKGGHWFALVRDRDGALYICNDSQIIRDSRWRNFKGRQDNDQEMIFLYELNQESRNIIKLNETLNELRGSLAGLLRAIKPPTYD